MQTSPGEKDPPTHADKVEAVLPSKQWCIALRNGVQMRRDSTSFVRCDMQYRYSFILVGGWKISVAFFVIRSGPLKSLYCVCAKRRKD